MASVCNPFRNCFRKKENKTKRDAYDHCWNAGLKQALLESTEKHSNCLMDLNAMDYPVTKPVVAQSIHYIAAYQTSILATCVKFPQIMILVHDK